MFSWRFIKAFPKVALVIGVILGSTGLFAWWWLFRSPERQEQARVKQEQKREEIRKTTVEVGNRLGHLVLIDNELVDLDTGEVYFKNWLKEGTPWALYIEPERKTLLAQYPNGFVRYGLDGSRREALLHKYRLPFAKGYQWAAYCKDQNIWRADIDWTALKFVNERQVTTTGQFNDRFFAENLIFGTDGVLVVRLGANMVKVNLDTGEVNQVRYPLDNIDKRRSPNSKYLVGMQNGQFYCHDIETNETKLLPVGRGGINDYQWLGDDRCLLIEAGKKILLFDRLKNTTEEVAALPVHADKLGEPSPSGRYVLTYSRNGLCVVNVESKKAALIRGGQGIGWVNDDTLFFSRDVLDSNQRGSWIQKAGESERRIWEQPYLTGRTGTLVKPLKDAELVVFVTKQAVMRMNMDATDVKVLSALDGLPGRAPKLPSSLVGITTWNSK